MKRRKRSITLDDRDVWNVFFRGREGSADCRDRGTRGGEKPALLGILWVRMQAAIGYEVQVNGQPQGTRDRAAGGATVETVRLRAGLNQVDWTIRHPAAGWRHAAYLKVGDSVTKLCEDPESLPAAPATDARDIVDERRVRVWLPAASGRPIVLGPRS